MENLKFFVGVNVEFIDGKANIVIDATKGMTIREIRSCLVSAVNLSIRGEKTPKKQGEALREVIQYMENELVNVKSFDDAHISAKLK